MFPAVRSCAPHDSPDDDDEDDDRDDLDGADEEFDFAEDADRCQMDHQVDDQEDGDPERCQRCRFIPKVDEKLWKVS